MGAMKKGVKLLLTVCLFLLCTVFAGCGNANRAPHTEDGSKPRAAYAVILKSRSDAFTELLRKGIEEEAVRQGITADIFYAGDAADIHGQLQILKNCVERGYKAIGIAPLTEDADLSAEIAEANQKGIYMVFFGDTVNAQTMQTSNGIFAAVTADAERLGMQGANYIVSQLTKGGEVAVLSEGEADVPQKRGAEDAFRVATGIRLLSTESTSAESKSVKAYAERLMQTNPALKAFYCCNDKIAMETVQAVQSMGKSEEIMVVGTGGTDAARKSIENGTLTATIAVDFAEIGAAALREMCDAVKGGAAVDSTAAPEILYIDAYILEKTKR